VQRQVIPQRRYQAVQTAKNIWPISSDNQSDPHAAMFIELQLV
jgi:hypothetical protein